MFVCIMDQSGKILLHRNCPANHDALLEAIVPYREDLVVAVALMDALHEQILAIEQ
jgi:hypothetical protein